MLPLFPGPPQEQWCGVSRLGEYSETEERYINKDRWKNIETLNTRWREDFLGEIIAAPRGVARCMMLPAGDNRARKEDPKRRKSSLNTDAPWPVSPVYRRARW